MYAVADAGFRHPAGGVLVGGRGGDPAGLGHPFLLGEDTGCGPLCAVPGGGHDAPAGVLLAVVGEGPVFNVLDGADVEGQDVVGLVGLEVGLVDEQDHRGHDGAVGLAVGPGEVLEHAHFFACGLLAQVGEHIAELGLGGHFGHLDAGLVLERAVGKDVGELLGGGVGLARDLEVTGFAEVDSLHDDQHLAVEVEQGGAAVGVAAVVCDGV